LCRQRGAHFIARNARERDEWNAAKFFDAFSHVRSRILGSCAAKCGQAIAIFPVGANRFIFGVQKPPRQQKRLNPLLSVLIPLVSAKTRRVRLRLPEYVHGFLANDFEFDAGDREIAGVARKEKGDYD
jgi:hypothetical protein